MSVPSDTAGVAKTQQDTSLTGNIRIPGYLVEAEIGRGAVASVYLAVQESLDRKVALKVMSPALAAEADFSERFEREGRTVAQFSHPNIVTIFDVGVSNYQHYIAMEYLGGGSLKHKLGSAVDPDWALDIVAQIAAALGYAHGQGYVHRDVKPENVLFRGNGEAVLTDFGIAKSSSSNTQLTRSGTIVGTPRYMSPEQAQGYPATARSDIYSLGIILFEMLAGEPPFQTPESLAVLYSHINDPIPELPSSPELQGLVDVMMAKDPIDRVPDCETLLELIQVVRNERQQPTLTGLSSRNIRRPGKSLIGDDERRENTKSPGEIRNPLVPDESSIDTEQLNAPMSSGNSGWRWTAVIASLVAVFVSIELLNPGKLTGFLRDTPTQTPTPATPQIAVEAEQPVDEEYLNAATESAITGVGTQTNGQSLAAIDENSASDAELTVDPIQPDQTVTGDLAQTDGRVVGLNGATGTIAGDDEPTPVSSNLEQTPGQVGERSRPPLPPRLTDRLTDSVSDTQTIATDLKPVTPSMLPEILPEILPENPSGEDDNTGEQVVLANPSANSATGAGQTVTTANIPSASDKTAEAPTVTETPGAAEQVATTTKEPIPEPEPQAKPEPQPELKVAAAPNPTPKPAAAKVSRKQIERLLQTAQRLQAQDRVSSPSDGNAVSVYQKILAIDPQHKQASLSLQGIATDYYQRAKLRFSEDNLAEAALDIGRGLDAVPDYPELIKLEAVVRKRIEGESAYKDAQAYYLGDGVDRDFVRACRRYQQAAQADHVEAMVGIGVCYATGQGVARNDRLAIDWLEKAATAGSAQAQYWVGLGYLFSDVEDAAAAAYWVKAAVDQEYRRAFRVIGWMYRTGTGVDESATEAVRWGFKGVIGDIRSSDASPRQRIPEWEARFEQAYVEAVRLQEGRPRVGVTNDRNF